MSRTFEDRIVTNVLRIGVPARPRPAPDPPPGPDGRGPVHPNWLRPWAGFRQTGRAEQTSRIVYKEEPQ